MRSVHHRYIYFILFDCLGLFLVFILWVLPLIIDRTLGKNFYLSDIHISGEPLDIAGSNPVLTEHVFWFLGHFEIIVSIFMLAIIVFGAMYLNLKRKN